MKIWLAVLLGIVVAGVLYFAFVHEKKTGPLSFASIIKKETVTPTPTPFEFSEYTIPYLRQRSYESSLGERAMSYDNANYTAYLTSYTSDGFKVNGLLTQPKGTMPEGGWPAIIFIHGYIPPSQYNTNSNYYDYVDYLARNGFVVFKIDLRGHGTSEGEPGGAYYSADYVIDALSARKALQGTDFVNPDKIGLWGHSMAGNVVMRSLAAQPDIPAVVIWAGAVYTYEDMAKYGISDSSYQPPAQPQATERASRRQRIRDIYGEPSNNNEFWRLMAPTNFLNDIKGAIQINHAVNDEVVSINYSRDLNKLLDETQVKHELHEYTSGGHNISGTSFNEAMQNTAEFFRENL